MHIYSGCTHYPFVRAFNRVIKKTARTIADLEAGHSVHIDHISVVIQCRNPDRGWPWIQSSIY